MSTPPDPPPPPSDLPPPANQPWKVCNNCGQSNDASRTLCENCGAALPSQAWPPNANFVPIPQLKGLEESFILKNAVLDRILGALITGLLSPIYGLGILAAVILYFNTKKYAYFQQGLLVGCGIWLVVLLGAFVWCLYALSGGHGL